MSAKYEFVRHLSARMTSADWSEMSINTARIQKIADRIPVLVLDTLRAKGRYNTNYNNKIHLYKLRYIYK